MMISLSLSGHGEIPLRKKRLTSLQSFLISIFRSAGAALIFYQSILDNEEYTAKTAKVTTLAGYIHFLLSGENAVGIGEASGIFPVMENDYDRERLAKYGESAAAPFPIHG